MSSKVFEIHPHSGYLNTSFEITNVGEKKVTIFDRNRIAVFRLCELAPGETQSMGLILDGEHIVCSVTDPDDETSPLQEEFVNVEDAIKLGGGRETEAYVSENSPWALVKMTDRLYFHNTATGREGVEMNLTPEKIELLGKDLALFYTENEACTLYTFRDFSSLFSSKNAPVFRNDSCIVFDLSKESDGQKRLIIFDFNEGRHEYDYEQFCVNRETGDLYVYFNGKIEVVSHATLEIASSLTPKGFFFTFIESGFYVCRDVYGFDVYDIRHPENRRFGKIDNNPDIIRIGEVNVVSKEALEEISAERQTLFGKVSKQAKTYIIVSLQYKEIEGFYYTGEHLYFVERVSKKELYKMEVATYLRGVDIDVRVPISQNSSVMISDGSLLIDSYKQSIHVLPDGDFVTCNAKFLKVKDNYVLSSHENGKDRLLSLSGEVLVESKYTKEVKIQSSNSNVNLLLDYGLVATEYSWNRKILVPVFPNGMSLPVLTDVGQSGNHLLLNDGSKSYVLLENDSLRDISSVSLSLSCILSVSENADRIISAEKNSSGIICGLFLSVWNSAISAYDKVNILVDKFDSSVYRDVLFAGDGEYIVYSNSEGSFFCENLESGQVSEYKSEKFLQQINGYRSEIKFIGNGAALPRVIDPVTGQFLDASGLADYRFMNPDSSMVIEKALPGNCAPDGIGMVEYIHRRTKEHISPDRYSELSRRYNISFHQMADDRTMLDRIEFMKTDPNSYAEAINKYISSIDRFQDLVIKPSDLNNYEKYETCPWDRKQINDAIELYAKLTKDVLDPIIESNEYVIVKNTKNDKKFKLDLGIPLWFLNYISFSYDSRYIAIAGRYPDNTQDSDGRCLGGLYFLYDLSEHKIVEKNTGSSAVWISAFTRQGASAYYDSAPCTYFKSNPDTDTIGIRNRNFLTFSPSGRLFALSNQGYIRMDKAVGDSWGHQPSTNVYIHDVSDPEKEIAHYNDHGAPITNTRSKTVCMVAFSSDDKKMLSVSNDGVVVIRNLHFFDENEMGTNDDNNDLPF